MFLLGTTVTTGIHLVMVDMTVDGRRKRWPHHVRISLRCRGHWVSSEQGSHVSFISFTSTPPSPPLGWCSATDLPAFVFRFLKKSYAFRANTVALSRKSTSSCSPHCAPRALIHGHRLKATGQFIKVRQQFYLALVLWHCVGHIACEDSWRTDTEKEIIELGSYNGRRCRPAYRVMFRGSLFALTTFPENHWYCTGFKFDPYTVGARRTTKPLPYFLIKAQKNRPGMSRTVMQHAVKVVRERQGAAPSPGHGPFPHLGVFQLAGLAKVGEADDANNNTVFGKIEERL
ncbi:hypothetical protein BGW80DRAFT_1253801 [Lactifluus volemus]|nr:hypothetical protein BGW80DRAFT_1253801 [Lactifluus volemus]